MMDWIKDNRMAVSLFVASMTVLFISLAAAGCQVSDLITVDVPTDVKEAVGVDGRVSLTQIPDVWDDWQDYVEKNTKRLESSTERSYELLGFINSATDVAIGAAEGAASSFPGGALLVGLLSGAAGLYMKKPGTDRAIAKEKEASYNAGMEKARALAQMTGLGDVTNGSA
jgi:hypothetical protein